MNELIILSAAASSEGDSSTQGSTESLKKIFTNPVLYIVLGALVLLILIVYLVRKNVRATPNATTIIVRKGQIQKVLDENNPKYFMIPFRDSVGAIITKDEKELNSDKLFINNGPDALYKINYTLKYKVLDPVAFYPFLGNIEELLVRRLNDDLRLYADQGNALTIVKDYREKEDAILEVINKGIAEYHLEATSFKINLIEPMGK